MKLKSGLFLYLFIGVCLLTGCEDETTHRGYPRVTTTRVTNISASGATFIGEITDIGNAPITEHGFVWSKTKNLEVDYQNRVLLGSFNGIGEYTADIKTTLEPNVEYYVGAYLKAGEYIVYGKTITFISLGSQAPTITGFSPDSAGWGDTVTVMGKNFSWVQGFNKVYIGGKSTNCVIPVTDSTLKTIVPSTVREHRNAISVEISGNAGTLKGDSLLFLKPELHDYYPKAARWGDTISFYGRYLRCFADQTGNGVSFGGLIVNARFIYKDTVVKVIVPYQLTSEVNPISIKLNGFSFYPDTVLSLLPPVIDSISPDEGTWGTILTLYGRFNILSTMNNLSLNSVGATLVASERKLKVTVPATISNYENTISLTSGPFKVESPEKFYLKKPEIKYFTPSSGGGGTLVKIGGKYFKSGITSVSFGTVSASIKSVNDSVIYCYVPSVANGSYKLKVKASNSAVESSSYFAVKNPTITSISPTSVYYGDVVTVVGENFNDGLTWHLGTIEFTPLSVTSTEAKFTVPYTLLYTPLHIDATYILNTIHQTTTSLDYLTLKDFTVNSIAPLTGKPGDLLTLTGTNFNPSHLTVSFGTTIAKINNVTSTSASVIVPDLSNVDYNIMISYSGKSVIYPEKFNVNGGPWTRLNDLPFLYDYGCVFDFGEVVYVATAGPSSTEKEIYSFDVVSKGFTKTAGTYSSSIVDPIACTLNGKGYIIGHKATTGVGFELFNPDSLVWRKLPDYPGTQTAEPVIISTDSVIYAGSGRHYNNVNYYYNDMWKYSPVTNKWTNIKNIQYLAMPSNQIYLGGTVYFSTIYNFLYKYDASDNLWVKVSSNTPFYVVGGTVSAILNDKWYVGCGDSHGLHSVVSSDVTNKFYSYDPGSNVWKASSNGSIPARSMPLYFTASGYMFVGGSQRTHLYDFYMYDPSKE